MMQTIKISDTITDVVNRYALLQNKGQQFDAFPWSSGSSGLTSHKSTLV